MRYDGRAFSAAKSLMYKKMKQKNVKKSATHQFL